MKNLPRLTPILLLTALLFVFWLLNYGPFQTTTGPVEAGGLWAHNLYNYYLPEYDYAFRRMSAGQLPLWNPFQAGGVPTLAALQAGVFYPANVLFLLTSPETAIGLSTLFHICLAGLFTYLFFRSVFPSEHSLGAWTASIAFVFSPRLYEYVLFPGNFMSACWLPVILYLGDRVILKRSFRSCALLGMSVGMPLLAGFPQVAVHIYMLLILFLFCRIGWLALAEGQKSEAVHAFGLCALAAVIALLVVSPQLIPTYELAGQSTRTPGLVTIDMSQVYGPKPYAASTWLAGVLTYPDKMEITDGWHPIPPWGIFLLLGILGVTRRRNIGKTFFFLIVGVVFLVLSFGTNTHLYRLYWEYFPLGNWFTTPIRLRYISYFCFALLAGRGMDMLQDRTTPEWESRTGSLYRLASVAIMSAAMIAASLTLVGLSAPLTYPLIALHLALVTALLLMRTYGSERSGRGVIVALMGVVVIESCFWYTNKIPFPAKVRPRETLYRGSVADSIKSLEKPGRIHIENGWGLKFFGLPTVPEKFGSLYEIPAATNWEPMSPGFYQDFCNHLTGRKWYYGRFQIAGRPFSKKMLDMLNVRYVVFSDAGNDWITEMSPARKMENGYRLAADLGAEKIYENIRALDRVNFAKKWETFDDTLSLFQRMREESFDPTTTVLLTEVIPERPVVEMAVSVGTSEHSAIRSYSAGYEAVEIDVEAIQPGIVWISDCYYPGWKAFVDGTETRVLRVNHAFRGVYVGDGRHTIRMRFEPPLLRWGLLAGGGGLFLCLIMVVMPGSTARRTGRE